MIKKVVGSSVAIIMMVAGVITMPAWAEASTSATATPAAATGKKADDVGPPPTNAELNHYVTALAQVHDVVVDMQLKLKNGKISDAESTKLKQDTEVKVENIVKKNKLTTARYMQITQAVQVDPAVRKKAQAIGRKIRP